MRQRASVWASGKSRTVNTPALIFVVCNAVALLALPRAWAPLPLIVGACYMTLGQGIEVGPLTFTVIRILIAVGVLRVLVRREWMSGGMQALDWLMVLWALWAGVSSLFHEAPFSALIFRLGFAYNACGIYFLIRSFCSSVDDNIRLIRCIAVLLIPIAIAMVYEQAADYNVFSILGGVPDVPELREGRFRASGPFAHPILAGTVGAVSVPLMIGLWRYHRIAASAGALSSLAMVLASASSGPAMSTVFGVGALFLWPYRAYMRRFRWAAVCAYIGLDMVMRAPAYYLIARIDVVGGSAGWHRARLIESALEHLTEWWLAGTDYTRHWMATGLAVSPNHTDITNHYLFMGIMGGLPLMFMLIAILAKAFSAVGKAAQRDSTMSARERFVVWAMGASLVAHAATWVSIAYFDQSVVFVYLTIGAIASANLSGARADTRITERAPSSPYRVSAAGESRWRLRNDHAESAWATRPVARRNLYQR
jgi:hypothetical protein